MERQVAPEWLDELPATDSRAQRSRADLMRLNRCMGHARIVAQALKSAARPARSLRLLELGAGDGDFLLRVAGQLDATWAGTEATLIDRQDLLSDITRRGFDRLGWRVQVCQRDVFDWSRNDGAGPCDVIIANLFLHHFDPEKLRPLLATIRQRSGMFVALEPRRALFPLLFSNLVGFIGCNEVTRHDAPVSVRAGFFGGELSALWSGNGQWTVCERPAGMFSHLFVASRKVMV